MATKITQDKYSQVLAQYIEQAARKVHASGVMCSHKPTIGASVVLELLAVCLLNDKTDDLVVVCEEYMKRVNLNQSQ